MKKAFWTRTVMQPYVLVVLLYTSDCVHLGSESTHDRAPHIHCLAPVAESEWYSERQHGRAPHQHNRARYGVKL